MDGHAGHAGHTTPKITTGHDQVGHDQGKKRGASAGGRARRGDVRARCAPSASCWERAATVRTTKRRERERDIDIEQNRTEFGRLYRDSE